MKSNNIKIKYKAIYQYIDHKETKTYFLKGNKIDNSLSFFIDGQLNTINWIDNKVQLSHGNSKLNLELHKRIENDYFTNYGSIKLDTYLEVFKIGDSLKLKYSLYDNEEKLVSVYLLLSIIEEESNGQVN